MDRQGGKGRGKREICSTLETLLLVVDDFLAGQPAEKSGDRDVGVLGSGLEGNDDEIELIFNSGLLHNVGSFGLIQGEFAGVSIPLKLKDSILVSIVMV